MDADLLLCTGNPGKLAELRALLPPSLRVIGLAEAGLPSDLPENGTPLEANAEERPASPLTGQAYPASPMTRAWR